MDTVAGLRLVPKHRTCAVVAAHPNTPVCVTCNEPSVPITGGSGTRHTRKCFCRRRHTQSIGSSGRALMFESRRLKINVTTSTTTTTKFVNRPSSNREMLGLIVALYTDQPEAFSGFLHSPQTDFRDRTPQLGYRRFHPNPFQIMSHSAIRRSIALYVT
jgi:hypothetical protein